ncbi:MAG: DUF664 domain-containing protein [Fimbriimonadaceae bacterium]|nr:DUF664 domain-containing protein [Fimbriimonadaceae bacterium]
MHSEVHQLIEAWHWMYFETDLVLGDVKEENLHRRPAPNLLSISEHLAHVSRSEASIFCRYIAGQPDEEWQTSVMTKPIFGWPPTMLEHPVDTELTEFDLPSITGEYLRLHEHCYRVAQTIELGPDHRFDDSWERIKTLRDRLRIAAYHVAYHAGQIYTVRHLLGEDTPEN